MPNVRKAVKWNSPFYGIEGQGWFLGFHVFTRYVKVAFFRGTSLRPVPPGASKGKDTRYIDIHEDDEFDEAQMASVGEAGGGVAGLGAVDRDGYCAPGVLPAGRPCAARSSLYFAHVAGVAGWYSSIPMLPFASATPSLRS